MTRCYAVTMPAGSRIVAAADGMQGGVETVWERQKGTRPVSRKPATLATAERVGRYIGPGRSG